MQHLAKQSEPTVTRKWNFDQNWNNIESAILRENCQRTDDVQITKENIQNKINSLTQLENSKVQVMNDNVRFLKTQANGLQKSTEKTIENAKDHQNDYENKCIDFASDYLNNAQIFSEKILSYAQNKCTEVERRLNVVDQNIKRKTEQQMQQLRQSSINHIKKIMSTESANQKGHVENLLSLVSNSLKNMRQTLKQYEKQSLKTQANLQQQINTLDKEMFTLINTENKQGDMTYDCLLKLVQDSCGKIQMIRMRG